MTEICRLWILGLIVSGFLKIWQVQCQYGVRHPVTFVQTARVGEWTHPQAPRNPPWHQFSAPRKRSSDAQPIYYEGQLVNQPYNYRQAYSNPRYAQNFQRHPHLHERRSSDDLTHSEARNVPNDPRLLSESAFTKISETLGAINTVGHYIVDMVNDDEDDDETNPNLKRLPQALYTISKNVLGKNVTEKIAPIVKTGLARVLPGAPITKIATADIQEDDAKSCTTPEGEAGVCEDLSNCPQLLLNLVNLRESFCFRDLFVPGVCCPKNSIIPPVPAEEKPVETVTSKPTYLLPVTTQKPTTKRPSAVISLTTKRPKPQVLKPVTSTKPTTSRPITTITTQRPVSTTSFYTETPPLIGNFSNIVDEKDCGQQEVEGGRVMGGTVSTPGEWPWMAAIFLQGNKRKEFWCGGTLVGKKHVLTAAHCTRDTKQKPFPARQFIVRLGDVDLSRDDEPSRPVNVRVTAVRSHEGFARVGYYNDIAVLVLADNVQKSKYVIPICLPYGDLSRQRFEGSVATVVGWGTTRHGGPESSTQLEAQLPVWSNEECNRAYFQPITDEFMCAGYRRGGIDACQGDSGGPLMLSVKGRWTQIGVVSFGNKCGEPGYPGVYTRVTNYLPWLQTNLA